MSTKSVSMSSGVRRVVSPRTVIGFVGAVIASLVMFALPAGAHVGVSSDDAAPGSFALITFRVPSEEDAAHTTGLKVQLPVDNPIAFVSVQPKPGWTVTTKMRTLDRPIESHGTTITEAVSEITWSGGKIGPGEFDLFNISAGPLPEGVDSLTFKAIQTYTDAAGKTSEVAWIQTEEPGGAEADRPAPVLQLTGSGVASGSTPGSSGDADDAVSSEPAMGAAQSGDASGAAQGDDATASAEQGTSSAKASTAKSKSDALSVLAMAVGASGLVMAIFALIFAIAARQKLTMVTRDAAGSGEDPSD